MLEDYQRDFRLDKKQVLRIFGDGSALEVFISKDLFCGMTMRFSKGWTTEDWTGRVKCVSCGEVISRL